MHKFYSSTQVLLFFVLLASSMKISFAQFTTPTLYGSIANGEYGIHADGNLFCIGVA